MGEAADLSILYRGPLSSCNYDCAYCPFAKHRSTAEELAADRAALARFVDWVAGPARAHGRLGILFTPWGEALTRSWYREAMVRLSHLSHVERVVAQTNLSGSTAWMADADPGSLALWTTFHPGQVALERFVANVEAVHALGVRSSVGVVAVDEHHELARALRARLPRGVHLWINLAHSQQRYEPEDILRWAELDEDVVDNVAHRSLGRRCRAGHDAISVDGDGVVRRCHFVAEPIGNIADGALTLQVAPSPCPELDCSCHIGYVHLEHLGLRRRYAGGLLERIPGGPRPAH